MKLFRKLKKLVGVKELPNNNLKIEVTDKHDKKAVQTCEKIAWENNVKNGGTLYFTGIVANWSNFLITCKKDKKIVGYISLTKNYMKKGDLYVGQIAVKKDFQGQGIGTAMYNYLIHHSKGYTEISAHVNEDNIVSQKTLKNAGFTEYQVAPDKRFYALDTQKIKDNAELQITVKNELIR